MPVEWRPDSADRMRFPNALMDWVAKGVTVRERIMLEFINLITDKPDWDRKVFDEDIVRNWRQEALVDGANFSEKMFEFVSVWNSRVLRMIAYESHPLAYFLMLGASWTMLVLRMLECCAPIIVLKSR